VAAGHSLMGSAGVSSTGTGSLEVRLVAESPAGEHCLSLERVIPGLERAPAGR
jgi:hypothetical protein